MKNKMTKNSKKAAIGKVLKVIFLLWLISPSLNGLCAEPLEISLGAGVYYSSVYYGSDETYFSSAPMLKVAYNKGPYSAYASILEGMGMKYRLPGKNLIFGMRINGGEERDSKTYKDIWSTKNHSDEVRNLLQGSPNVKSNVITELSIGYLSESGTLACSVEYHPIKQTGEQSRSYNGFLSVLSYSRPFRLTDKMALSASASVRLMDENYADAWYSVKYETDRLKSFNAGAGVKDIQLSLQLDYAISKKISAVIIMENSRILMDAVDSPYTTSKHQMTSAVFVVYSF